MNTTRPLRRGSGRADRHPHATKSGENGGWYGVTDGDYYSGLPTLNDPAAPQQLSEQLPQPLRSDGFFNGSTWDRIDMSITLDPVYWFPTTAMPAWGLYHYQYGFQPSDTTSCSRRS